jgi:cation transport regulator ChaB
MGKSQYKNKTRRRHNPIRVPDAHLGTGAAAAAKAAKEQDVLPVIKKVQREVSVVS